MGHSKEESQGWKDGEQGRGEVKSLAEMNLES